MTEEMEKMSRREDKTRRRAKELKAVGLMMDEVMCFLRGEDGGEGMMEGREGVEWVVVVGGALVGYQ